MEPNETKATSNSLILSSGDSFSGTSAGSGNEQPAVTTYDTYLIQTEPAPLAIYQHRLIPTTTPVGARCILTILGLPQAAGVIGSTEAVIYTSTSSLGSIRWYGFGKQERVYVRAGANPTSNYGVYYTCTLESTPITPLPLTGEVRPGPVTFSVTRVSGSVNPDIWLYDAELNAITDAGNQGPATSAGLTRTLAAGTYYLAVGTTNLANNLASPSDDTVRSQAVLDFPDAVCGAGTQAGSLSITLSDTDAGTTDIVQPFTAEILNGVNWLQLTVGDLPGACCTGTACAVVAGAPACSGTYQGTNTACGLVGNPTTCCSANFNQVGGLSVQDIFDFLAGYFGGNPNADINNSGSITVQDIFDFLDAYFTGC